MPKIVFAVALSLAYLISAPLTAAPDKAAKPATKAPAPRAMPAEFMGVKLGAKFGIKECAVKTFPYGVSSVYDFSTNKNTFPCWHGPRPGSNYVRPEGDAFEVDIIPSKSPSGTGNVRLLILKGQIEGLTYSTSGFESQDELLQALVEKLGPPTVTETIEKQNAVGAKFSGRTAAWAFTEGRAGFLGIGSRVDSGFGNIYTSAGAAHVDAQREPQGAF